MPNAQIIRMTVVHEPRGAILDEAANSIYGGLTLHIWVDENGQAWIKQRGVEDDIILAPGMWVVSFRVPA